MAVIIEFGYLPYGFTGFARQPNERTVEGEIIRVLTVTGAVKDPKGFGFKSSSRTDKGVGAFQNFFVFYTDIDHGEILRRLNSMIEGAFFYGAGNVGNDFNPRHAVFRDYVYYLPKCEIGNNISGFEQALSLFQGTHCFLNFSKKDRTKSEDYFRREMKLEPIVVEESSLFGVDMVFITFRSRFFLYGQIRKILAAAVMAGNDKISMKAIGRALAAGSREKRFPSHSPDGLFLKRIKLPDEIEANILKYPLSTEGLERDIRDQAMKYLVSSHLLERISGGT